MKGCALNWTVLCQRKETFLETCDNSSSSFDLVAKITLAAWWIQTVFKQRHQNMTPHSFLWNTHRTVKSHLTVGSAHGALHCGTDAISVIAFNSALMAVCSVGWYSFLCIVTPKIVIVMKHERCMPSFILHEDLDFIEWILTPHTLLLSPLSWYFYSLESAAGVSFTMILFYSH